MLSLVVDLLAMAVCRSRISCVGYLWHHHKHVYRSVSFAASIFQAERALTSNQQCFVWSYLWCVHAGVSRFSRLWPSFSAQIALRLLWRASLVVIARVIFRTLRDHSSGLTLTPPNKSMERKFDSVFRLATPSLKPASISAHFRR